MKQHVCENIQKKKFSKSVISSTADGASPNFGKYIGILTQQKENRPWLITIYCVGHRVEVALKEKLLKFK